MLEIKDLSYHYKKGIPSLNNVSLSIKKGKMNILLGKNGSGKSTLMKCILSLYKGYDGKILFNEKDVKSLKRKELAKSFSYLPQEIPRSSLTVYDTLLLGKLPYLSYRNHKKEEDDSLNEIIEELHLEGLIDKTTDELSGGERQKVMIAKALVQKCDLLVLDEPTSSLDIENQTLLLRLLERLVKEKGLTVLLSLHDINMSFRFGDYFFFLKDGNLIHQGNINSVNEDLLKQTFDTDFRLQIDEYGHKFVSIGE